MAHNVCTVANEEDRYPIYASAIRSGSRAMGGERAGDLLPKTTFKIEEQGADDALRLVRQRRLWLRRKQTHLRVNLLLKRAAVQLFELIFVDVRAH